MAFSDNPLEVFFDLVPTGAALYTPLYDAHGELIDFRFVRLNPVGQRLLGLPAQPPRTFCEYFPDSVPAGVFAWHRTAYLTDQAAPFDFPYDGDGLDTYFRLVARRSGELLVVSFTDMADLPRSGTEQALRDSQAHAQARRADAETRRAELESVFAQAPVGLVLFQGPEYRIDLANAMMGQIWGRPLPQVLGQPVLDAMPEFKAQGFTELLADVYHRGTPYNLRELPVTIARTHMGLPGQGFFNVIYQPHRDLHGDIVGIVCLVVEVTDQVLARRQVQALNDTLQVRNAEYQRANAVLADTQQQLQQINQELEARVQVRTQELAAALAETAQLNQELESRVQVRTREAEAARAATERERGQLQSLLTQAPVAIALLQGEDLRVVSANALMAEIWGYTPAEVVGRPLLEGVPELRGQGFDELLRQVMATQVPVIGTETPAVLRRNGHLQTSYYNFVYQPLYDAEGQVVGVIDVVVEVTEQVLARRQVERLNADLEARVQQRTQVAEQAQAEAERQRQRVTDLVTQAPAAMCVVGGPEFTYEAFNPLYAAMFGGRPRLGRPMGEVLPEVVNHPGFLTFRAVYTEGRTIRESEVLVPLARLGDGVLEDHYFSYTQQPRYDSQGQIDGVFVFAVEVTDQVLARQQVQVLNRALTTTNADLHQSNTQLTRTNVDLDNFIYTASHDLKAPITNIEGLLLALEHELPESARTGDVPLMLTLMQDAVDRFRRTIDHLTDLSRLQKEHTPDADVVALAPVVEAVRLDLTPLLAHTQGHLAVRIPEGLTVTFAEKNLRSVVYNLLSNAFKYRHPDREPEVQLRGWLADDHAVLEVQDNGLGLDLAQGEDKLFAMFQRLHSHVEGTGVGLYMVKRIVENAGGRIEVTSEVGQGSTFRVYFPR